MKYILSILMASAMTLSAQSNLEKLLAQGIEQAAVGIKPVPREDRAVVINKTAELLQKHVTFRADGISSAYSTATGSRQSLEWKNLRIRMVSEAPITEADRLNGLEKRYHAILGCDAARRWDTKTNAWTPWSPTGHLLFPTAIIVDWKNGAVTASGGTYLPKFTPGPGQSIVEAANQPAGKTTENRLPSGMQRKE